MPWFAEPNVVARDAEVLALRKRVRVLVLGGCWPLPYMRRHAVKDLHRISTCPCHRRFVTVVEAISVLAHRSHWIVRHSRSPLSVLLASSKGSRRRQRPTGRTTKTIRAAGSRISAAAWSSSTLCLTRQLLRPVNTPLRPLLSTASGTDMPAGQGPTGCS